MTSATRRYDLDWLRIGATYLLFPYHVAKTFDILPIYHIKNGELSPTLNYFTMFVHQWHMPLFFVLAGWSAHASMARRGAGGFLKERVQRLLVPFLMGSLLLCPFLKYAELSSGMSITAAGGGTAPGAVRSDVSRVLALVLHACGPLHVVASLVSALPVHVHPTLQAPLRSSPRAT
jgi:hypothetical protein